MLQPKADIFDRVEQTIEIMKKHLLGLIIPLFLFNFIFFGIISLMFMGYIGSIVGDLSSLMGDGFLKAMYSADGMFVIAIGMFLGLLYSLLYIPVLLTSIRSIHQAAGGEKITVIDNIVFGFKNILSSFRTYWYIFKYVYLIPAMIFIVGGVLFNLLFFFDITGDMGDMIKIASIFIMVLSFVLLIIFSIYRGLRSTFVLYSAITNESFTQNDFNTNIQTTQGKLLRIWGNFFLLGIILYFVSAIIGSIVGIFLPNSVDLGMSDLLSQEAIGNLMSGGSINDVIDVENLDLDSLNITFSSMNYMINTFVKELLASVFSVFVFVFTYIFMKRLEVEKSDDASTQLTDNLEEL